MKVINADELKEQYPERRSLNDVLDQAKEVSITQIIEDVKTDMCDNYCKIPYQYSKGEWEQLLQSDDSPCNKCPLLRL